ncbi:MAG: hypothetical protein Q8R82_21385 [Hyphomonadaceae bacterium]|nr:hypothetical protein [Hyphomonadaceae bacterium]
MRAFRAGFAALAFGAAFAAGCSQQGSGALGALDVDAKSVEAFATKLAGETFKGKATAAADIAGLRDALPKDVAITWGNLSFDAASGSTLLTDVKLTPKDMPQVGLGIQELRLFDFDAEFAKARIAGQRLTETAPLASRIDAKGVSLFGMAAMLNAMTGVPADTDVAIPADPADPTLPADASDPADMPSDTEPFDFDESMFATNWERYDLTFGRVILNDIVLRPFEVAAPAATAAAPAPDPYGLAGPGGEFVQQYIGIFRSFGIDTFASYDMKADLGMTQMGQTMSATFGAKSMATRGWRGGDFDASYARDMTYAIDMGASDFMQTPAINFQYSVDYLGMEDLRFDKLYGYIAKGVAPPRTETDIVSFGSYIFENQKLNVAGKELMSIGESTLDAREFHWFIPTKITGTAKNAVFDIAAMMDMAEAATGAYMPDPSDPDAQFAPAMPDMTAIKAALEKNGFAKPNLNFNFGWNWNATSGDAKVDLGFGGEKLMQFTTKYEGGFPSFKAVSDLIPEDPMQTDDMAIAKVFDEKSTLKLVDINVVDSGGLDKMFNLMADLAPIMAAGDPSGVNPMEGQTGESLRQMAGGMLTMLGATPDFAPYINPLSNFIMQGGKLHIGLKPAQPMTFTALSESLMGTTMADPAAQLKQLGLKVEHSK